MKDERSTPIEIAQLSASAAASAPVASAEPIVAASASAAPQVSSLPAAETLRESITLAEGKSCTIVLHKEPLGDFDRVAVEPGPDCAAQTLFDLDAEMAADPQGKLLHEGLMHYHPLVPGDPSADESVYADVNFDGFVDIVFVHHQGGCCGDYNAHIASWTYDPKTHRFSRNVEFEQLPNPMVDPQKKLIRWGGRESGPYYIDGQSGWFKGKLETIEQTETILGEAPDGKPLPQGFEHWEIRKQRRNGVLVKVFDGPVKAP